ncbi:ABC transporter [Azoarcus sp. DD4]|uniref:ABC transporter ATP-binding protein n=1 Tax=Azoarcus sp. DD4 TaxID=2027405 RepID=UPI00112948F7|nr:ABC transporter ATP-binding protein [Azoarcus sp. DD4]QDF95102.1 ABC transporter [Azoarcus sp. DD4]
MNKATPDAAAARTEPLAVLRDIHKRYRLDKTTVVALDGVDLDIAPARFTVITGPSGSGKSTLLHLLGALDRADAGKIRFEGRDFDALDDDALSAFRAQHIGFVFQSFNLLPVLTALENVEYPMRLGALPAAARRARALELLASVGLADKARHRPSELSGGQRQRVAIARALANAPRLLLADEPTANLDRATGAGIIALLRRLQRETGTSVVFSSHDPAVLDAADIRVTLVDGRIEHLETLAEVAA